MNVAVTVRGFSEMRSAFNKSRNIIQAEQIKAINEITNRISGQAVTNAPVKTGTLRSRIHAEPAIVQDSRVVGKVGVNINYAPYQEFGTRYITGKFYLTRAFNSVKSTVTGVMKDMLSRVTAQIRWNI